MTKEDIIRMALGVGMYYREIEDEFHTSYSDGICLEELQRFAALVAAHEREACAKVCEEGGKDESGRIHVQAWGCAKAIRARSNT